MNRPATVYNALTEKYRRIAALGDAMAMLSWDRQTMMPSGAAPARAEQMAVLAVMKHEAMTAPDIQDLLDAAENEVSDEWRLANLREIRRRHAHATAVSPQLVEALTKASAACEAVWLKARPVNDFAAVVEPLEELVALTREAECRKPRLDHARARNAAKRGGGWEI